jgi:hypothetical protein
MVAPGSLSRVPNAWTADELARIGQAEELELASWRADGSLRSWVPLWVARVGDDVYVRSMYGRSNPWFQRALASGEGRIRAGGVERDVTFEEPGSAVDDDLHAAIHAKYDRHGARIVATVTSPESALATVRLVPR